MATIERAARVYLTAVDEEVRSRARHAPPWIKWRIDLARRARGAPPLWGFGDGARGRAAAKIQQMKVFLAVARKTNTGH